MSKIGRAVGVAAVGVGMALGTISPAFAADNSPQAGAPSGSGNGLGSTGDLVSGLAGGAGTLGFLLPSPNGSGANFISGLMANPAAAITGTPNSILPYGLLDGGKPQPLSR
jgi:hypothetical protein